jgi:CYTH domain-containing protein
VARELERKFLVTGRDWKGSAAGTRLRQGYLSVDPARVVRVRVEGAAAAITVKGLTTGIGRLEFEYSVPVRDADEMLDALCLRPLIDKTRYPIAAGGSLWQVDEFHGDNEGLVLAEIELQSAGQQFAVPSWLGREVSGDPRYFNSNLVSRPYRSWGQDGAR